MKKKKIAINAISALQGGGQTYLTNLLKFAKDFPDMKFIVFCPTKYVHLFRLDNVEVVDCKFASRGLVQRVMWEKFCFSRILHKGNFDLVYCPGGLIGFKVPATCKAVVAFQNMLIYDQDNRQKYPLGLKRIRFFLLKRISNRTFKNADLVIFISKYAKKVIDKEVPNRKGKSVVIHHGVGNKPIGNKKVLNEFKIDEKGYFLYVSYLHDMKAQKEVIQAFARYKNKTKAVFKLLLVGKDCPPYGDILKRVVNGLNLNQDVIFTGLLDAEHVQCLYRYSKINIFASTCENCPNILIECLASGRPLFSSSIMPMPEIAKDAAIYFNPRDPDDLANLLITQVNNEEVERELVQKAKQRVLFFDWLKTSEITFRAFEDLMA